MEKTYIHETTPGDRPNNSESPLSKETELTDPVGSQPFLGNDDHIKYNPSKKI